MPWKDVLKSRIIFDGDGSVRRETWTEREWVDDEPLVEGEVVWTTYREPPGANQAPASAIPQTTSGIQQNSPSQNEEVEFAIRFSTCDDKVDAACWFKDRTVMTVEEGSRFDMHKEHPGCRCRVRWFTYSELQDWLELHGAEEACLGRPPPWTREDH